MTVITFPSHLLFGPLLKCHLSSDVAITALGIHIIHIVLLRTKPEMLGITTKRIIATMQHANPFWDWAACQFIDNARSNKRLVLFIYLTESIIVT
jgi:hypothetical protein